MAYQEGQIAQDLPFLQQPTPQPMGGGMPAGGEQAPSDKLGFLYNLARSNPGNSSYANMYLEEYMKSQYPEVDPIQQILEQMGSGGQDQTNGAQAFPNPYESQNSIQDTFTIDIPDQAMQGGQQPASMSMPAPMTGRPQPMTSIPTQPNINRIALSLPNPYEKQSVGQFVGNKMQGMFA